MTALVSSQSAFLLHPNHDRHTNSGGILLNSRSFSAPLNSHRREPRQPPSVASSSSSASHASDSHSRSSSTNGDASSRKIRFAPLPDPRREDFPSVFYQEDSDSDSATNNQLPRHPSAPPDTSPQAPSSPALSSHSISDTELQPDNATLKPKSKKWSSKLLSPLLQPLRPSSGNKAGDDTTSALFRISSRESTKTNGDPAEDGLKGGAPLSRRMSTGCRDVTSAKEAERSRTYKGGAPLAPVMSESGSKGRKDGQRMLNGRVYGRRPSSADRDRAEQKRHQDAAEPAFVEWGYGGMGSVNSDHARGRGSAAGPDWAKVQSKGKVLGEDGDGDGEGDDGSGMGWVRRRREQREREKKEKEEREKAQSQQGVPDIEIHPPQKDEKPQEPAQREPDHGATQQDAKPKDGEEHHIYRAVSVPAPHHHHARHHSHSHHKGGDASGTATPTSAPSLSRGNSVGSVPLIRTASLGSQGEDTPVPGAKKEEVETSSGSSVKSSASASSESQDEDDDEDTERESEDEEEEDEESRITSKCAGVEKISRHKE